ncbi:MAG: F0F1 ATP synthase subunit B [Acidimicrobiales bacterium]
MILASSDFGLSFALEWVALGIVVWFVVRVFPVPYLRPRMNDRAEAVRAELAAVEQSQHDAAELLAARIASLDVARRQAEDIVARARERAARLIAEGNVHAGAEYAQALARADAAIALARVQVRERVIREVGALVVTVAAKVVATELDAAGHHRLIDEAIAAAESERAS